MIALALAATLFAGEPAAPAFDRSCMDEYGRDLCEPATLAAIRGRFGASAAEALAAEGVQGVRVHLIDGYSNDMPMVAVLSKDATPATLEVRALVGGGEAKLLTAPASPWAREVAATLVRIVREAPEKPEPPKAVAPASGALPPPPTFCLHAWVAVIEVISDGQVTRRIRNACDGDALFDGAFSLSPIALQAFAQCDALEQRQYRNDSARLVGCAVVGGVDRLAAVTVRNRLDVFSNASRFDEAAVADRLSSTVEMNWQGETTAGRDAALAVWKEKSSEGARVSVVPTSVVGDGGAVQVSGVVVRWTGGENKGVSRAPFTQEWRSDSDHRYRVRRMTVGAFVPVDR